MSQGCFQRGPPACIRSTLRKDVFPLQRKRLPLPRQMRFVYLLFPEILRAAGKNRRLLLACCHLLLHRLAFPTTSHVLIVSGMSGSASHTWQITHLLPTGESF